MFLTMYSWSKHTWHKLYHFLVSRPVLNLNPVAWSKHLTLYSGLWPFSLKIGVGSFRIFPDFSCKIWNLGKRVRKAVVDRAAPDAFLPGALGSSKAWKEPWSRGTRRELDSQLVVFMENTPMHWILCSIYVFLWNRSVSNIRCFHLLHYVLP
jgi:hypothetical protein